ncbi:MAG: DUF3307 domain-containing protein [Paenisporosarcina sp.]|nr:DUF3307 domain-containing protein [Paenisporosarcina sp.]
MTVFSYMLIGHLMGDFLFQTSWMAMNKTKQWTPLLVHSVCYTVIVTALIYVGYGLLPLAGIILILGSHIILDRRTFVQWWVKNIMNTNGKDASWLVIIADQIFHLIILGVIGHFWF